MAITTETLNTFNAAVAAVGDLRDLLGVTTDEIEDAFAYEREQRRDPAALVARVDAAIAAYIAANAAIDDGRGDPDRFTKWAAKVHQVAGL